MAASVLYTNFGGMLVHEDRGGVERSYVHDEMGNTSFLVDATSVTDTYTYTPYGQVTHAGSNVTPFTFIGALGYFATGWSMLTSYVRARWYSNVSGAWGSVDPLWPMEPAYGYVRGNPAMRVDSDGLAPWYYNKFYKWIYTGDPNSSDEVFEAALDGAQQGLDCRISCMAELNKKALALIAALAALFAGGIPKGWFGLPTYGMSNYTSIASAIHTILVRHGINLGLRSILRWLKLNLLRPCAANPVACAQWAAIAYLWLNVIFAAYCAACCSDTSNGCGERCGG